MIKTRCLLLLGLFTVIEAANVPSKWKLCPKTNHEECLKETIPLVLADLKNGNKNLNVIPIDPLVFQQMEMNQKGPININLTFNDFEISGISRVKVNKAKIDWDNYKIRIDTNVINGPAYVNAGYNINGSVLVLPIRGNGKCNLTFGNFNSIIEFNGKELMKNDKKHFKVIQTKFIINPETVQFYFDNLFDGVPNLGETMNKFLNENSQEILGEMKETISKGIGLGITQIANNFFERIPVSQLYT